MVRHRGAVFLSVAIMSLSLLVLAVFLLATDNVVQLLDRTRSDFYVYVYLEDGLSQKAIEENHKRLLAMSEVESTEFVSKADALDEFRAELGDQQYMLESLQSNPLPASFRVTLRKPYRSQDGTAAFAASAATIPGVEDVSYGRDFIERFSLVARLFLYIDVALGMIVILSAVFIISNTVRLTVMTRRRTIEILKLVGATNRFITTPFIMEGAFQGGLAALVSLVLLAGVFFLFRRFVPDLSFLGTDRIVAYIATCIALGSIGSYTALRRFLKL